MSKMLISPVPVSEAVETLFGAAEAVGTTESSKPSMAVTRTVSPPRHFLL